MIPMRVCRVFVVCLVLQGVQSTFAAVLFQDDFGDGVADGWNEVHGTWSVVNGEYVGSVGGYDDTLLTTTGQSPWSDYTMSARMKASFVDGLNDFGLVFYAQSASEFLRFTIGGEPPMPRITHDIDLESVGELAIVVRNPTIVDGQWYYVSVLTCGDKVSAYVDGQLAAYASGLPFTRGYVGLIADDPIVTYDDVRVTTGANVFFPDYMPLDPNEHGVKTFEWTYGETGEYTSAISGGETVPYGSGPITGVTITNHSDWGTGVVSNDGACVRFLGGGQWYVSTDAALSSHPGGYVFGVLTDGQIIDQGEYYIVSKDLATWERDDNQMLLVGVQDVTVPQGYHGNAVVIWYLDTKFSFVPLDFHGKESSLGLALPSIADTAGYAPTAVEIYAIGTGLIAQGDIAAETGSLANLAELKEVAIPAPDLDMDMVMIMTEQEYADGVVVSPNPWDFSLDVRVVAPGALDHIDVTKPGGTSPGITLLEEEPNVWTFDAGAYPSLGALRAVYPEGVYTLEFRDSAGALLKTVSIDYSGLSAPGGVPMFTYPSEQGQADVSTHPSFTWTIDPGAASFLALGVDDDATGDQVYGAFPVPMTTTSWSPGPLLPNHGYHLDLTVSRVKGWVGPGLPTATVEGDEFTQYLTFDYMNTISFTTGTSALLHDWNDDGIVSIIGDVPCFVQCVYFDGVPPLPGPLAPCPPCDPNIGDCNHDSIISIIGDVPCFVDCVYFGNCAE